MPKEQKRKRKTYKLEDLDVLEVSLVPKGANLKQYILHKGVKMSREDMLKAILDSKIEDVSKYEKLFKMLSPEASEAVEAMLQVYEMYADELPEELFSTLSGLVGEPAPEAEEKAEEEVVEEEKAEAEVVEEAKAEDEDEDEELAKSLSPAVEQKLNEVFKQNEILKAQVEGLKAEKIQKQYAEEAATFAVPELSAEDVASLLLAADNGETGELIRKAFKAITNAFDNSGLTEPVGKAATPANDEDLEAKAAKLAEANGISIAKAYVIVAEEEARKGKK